jgi:AcrR family transcriptional regulator
MATLEVRTPDRILKIALELFSTRGYDATSVREICEAAGITKPTLYHFFTSKEGLYRALVDDTLVEFRKELLELLEIPGGIEERLKRVARTYFDASRARRDHMRFIFGLVHGPSTSAPATDFHRFYEDIVAAIARVVEEGVAKGELRPGPTDVRMLALMGALGEALCGYLLAGRPELTPALADTLVETILTGWHPRR